MLLLTKWQYHEVGGGPKQDHKRLLDAAFKVCVRFFPFMRCNSGVWMCCTDIPNVCVLDVEGTDGAEVLHERLPAHCSVA